jgi:RimJ/RimL family protein N-acetyltransferase
MLPRSGPLHPEADFGNTREMIETQRLILSLPSLADFDDSYSMASDPEIIQFIGGKLSTREDAWTKLLRNIGHWNSFGYGIFTAREKVSGVFVGEVGLAHFARDLGDAFDPYPEAAWVLAKRGHGKGYATEAVRAAHDWMIRQTGTKRTVCIIHPNNAASLRIAEKMRYRSFGKVKYRGTTPIMFERVI